MGRLILDDQEYTARPHPKQGVYSVTVGDVAERLRLDGPRRDRRGIGPWGEPLGPPYRAAAETIRPGRLDNAFGEINQLETIQDALKEARKGCTDGR